MTRSKNRSVEEIARELCPKCRRCDGEGYTGIPGHYQECEACHRLGYVQPLIGDIAAALTTERNRVRRECVEIAKEMHDEGSTKDLQGWYAAGIISARILAQIEPEGE